MFNNNNNYFGQQQGPGMGYAQQRQVQYTQPISAEQAKKLQSGGSRAFTMQYTEDELFRSICTHKDPNKGNQFSLVDNADGTQSCYICGTRFNLTDYNKDEVESAVQVMNDILNTIKTYYLTMPEAVAKEFMKIGIFINKIPQLYEIAFNDFNQLDGAGNLHNQYQPNAFSMLNNIMSPGAMMPQGNMMGMNNPIMTNPNMGYPQGNPFGGYDTQAPQVDAYGNPVNPYGYQQQGQYPQQPQYGQPQGQYPQQQPQGQPNMSAPNQPVVPTKPQTQQAGTNTEAPTNISTKMFNV